MRNKIINCSRTCALLLLVPLSYYSYYAKCRPTTTDVARLVGIYIYNISQHCTHFSLAPHRNFCNRNSSWVLLYSVHHCIMQLYVCVVVCVCVGVWVCIIIAVLLIVLWVSHVCYAAWALLSCSLREIFIKNAKALTLIVTYFNALAILLAFTSILALPGDAPRGAWPASTATVQGRQLISKSA